jgi:hypothetical protein
VPATAETHTDLPTAWRAAIAFCPYCSGTGEAAEEPCSWCEASGDLFGTLLAEAHDLGREEGVRAMRALYSDLIRAGRLVAERTVDRAKLKREVGL